MQAGATQSDNLLKFLAWVQVNRNRLILWGSIVVAAIAIAGFTIYYQGQKEVRASLAVASVPTPINPSVALPPGTAETYLKIAREHAGTKGAARALLQAGTTLFVAGNYAEAQKTFEQFVKDYPDSVWLPQAHYGIAASLDAQQKIAEATAKYEEVRRRFGSDPIIDEAKLALGRLYEAQNKPAEAHKLYAEVLQAHEANPYSGIGNEAGLRKSDLEAKFPHLARTNAPISATPPLGFPTNIAAPTNVQSATTNAKPAPAGAATNVPLLIQPGTTTNKQ